MNDFMTSDHLLHLLDYPRVEVAADVVARSEEDHHAPLVTEDHHALFDRS